MGKRWRRKRVGLGSHLTAAQPCVCHNNIHNGARVRGAGERVSHDGVRIGIANGAVDHARAASLLNRMYGWRGYGTDHALPTGSHCTTFVAETDHAVVGTLSLAVDHPGGLAADHTFRDILDEFRKTPGSSLCELAKFAFDTSVPAKARLAALFHTVLIFGSAEYNCTDLFIEVNPRHKAFYEASLGFRALAEPRTNTSVNAPSYLLWLSVDAIRQNIENFRRTQTGSKHSLYPYFLSPADEQRVAESFDRRAGDAPRPAMHRHLPGCERASPGQGIADA